MKSPFPAYWIFADERGQWSWKFATATGELIAASRHSYATQQECVGAIQLMRSTTNLATFGTIEDVEGSPKNKVPAGTTGAGEELNLTDEYAPWDAPAGAKADAVDHIPYMLKGASGAAGRR